MKQIPSKNHFSLGYFKTQFFFFENESTHLSRCYDSLFMLNLKPCMVEDVLIYYGFMVDFSASPHGHVVL